MVNSSHFKWVGTTKYLGPEMRVTFTLPCTHVLRVLIKYQRCYYYFTSSSSITDSSSLFIKKGLREYGISVLNEGFTSEIIRRSMPRSIEEHHQPMATPKPQGSVKIRKAGDENKMQH